MAAAGRSCLAAALLAFLASCGGGVQTGTAIERGDLISTGVKPVRPGVEVGFIAAFLKNTSKSTIVFNRVGTSGPGIGTIARPVQLKIAPVRSGFRHLVDSVPGAIYTMSPPVMYFSRRCHRQVLQPVRGYRMTPGSIAWIWIVVRAVKPGKWVIPRDVLYYTINGAEYQEPFPQELTGTVSSNARYIPPFWAEAKCVGPATGAHYLRGQKPHNSRTSG